MSAYVNYTQFLASLEKQWSSFQNGETENERKIFDANNLAKFNELIKLTLRAHLDFREILFASQELSTLKENIRIIISSLKLNDDLNYSVNIALNTEKWDSNLGQALLSGKLIGNASSKLYFLERKFQNESDDVIKARLDSLMHLLQNTNNNAYDTGQLVLNVYESYRKILLRDVNFQAKLSSETISTLLNNYLFILCHRKQFEHLHSAIKLFPIHRKLKYIRELLAKDNLSACEVHIAEGFLEDLLQKEFRKKKAHQNIKNYNVIISKISEVAANPLAKPHFNLERLVLSATTEVISEYYYLVATHLRFKMPVANNLVLKLISIGLSHDITYMENIKYATSDNQKERKEEFKKICRRMFLALVTLGCIIQNYTLRRLCFLAANVCEPDTRYCAELVKFLPESDEEKDESELDLISQDIRYQLETFQYDIRSNTNLPDSFDKSSNIIFESLEYFNHSIPLSEELKPLEYPGVEKYLKKQSIEDQQHISQTSDLDKCMRDIDEFNINLAERFKKVKTLYTSAELPLRKPTPPSNDEILSKVKGVFLKSDYLKTINNFGLFAEMFSISLVELLTENYEPKWMSTYEKTDDNNQEILLFDFNSDDGGSDEIDVDVLYREGIIPVRQLISREYLCYDIENILLYAIMEKKMKLIAAEFEYINKNRNVETDTVQNQVHAALLYMFSKPHPEYTRLLRLTGTQMRFVNPIDFLMETYVMDVMPGKFKYTLKNKILKAKPESFENFDSGSNQTIESGETMTTVMAPTMSEDNSMTVKMQVASFINNKQSKIKKEKLAAAISLSSTESFNVSNEILNIFYNLKHELAQVTGKEVLIDLNKLSDMSSTNTINCINATQSNLIIKCTRTRNSHLDPRERSLDIPMPLLMNGKLTLVNEIRDSIEYDEFFDNPKIQTTFTYRLIGTLIVENLSHNVKFDLDISIDGVVSKLKIVFQGIKNSRPRKKLVKHPIAEATLPLSQPVTMTNAFVQQSNSNTMPQVSNSAVQPSQPTPPLPQPALINSHASPPSCLPSFGTIVTSHYVPVNNSYENAAHSLPLQYSLAPASVPSMTPVIANGNHTTASSSSSYSSVIPTAAAPVPHAPPPPPHPPPHPPQCSSNGINYQLQSNQIAQSNQQFQPPNNFDLNTIKTENVQPHPISSPPTRVKVEILKVEDVSPMKLSFSNPCIVAKNDNTIQPSVVDANVKIEKQSVKNEADDELVDFEVAIQTSMVTSAVIPKKSALFPESIRSMQSTNKTIISPPPLHYHTPKISEKSIVEIPKNEPVVFKRELLQSPTKEICAPASNPPPLDKKPPEAEAKAALAGSQNVPKATVPVTKPQVFHKLTSNVIMKRTNLTEINGSKKNKEVLKVTDVIDLTDDNCDGNDYIKERPNQNLLDIQFVSCETQEPEFVALSPKINNRVARKRNFQNVPTGPKIRALKRVPSEDRSRKCKIRVVDILKNINQKSLKKNTRIELKPYHSNNLSENHVFKGARRSDFLAQEVPAEEQPIEEYADNLFDATFTIVCQNSNKSSSSSQNGYQ